MSDFSMPHLAPIRFVKSIISTKDSVASVNIGFQCIPTLGMLVEAAAQSSSAILGMKDDTKMGFLISLKNIKLLIKPKLSDQIVNIRLENDLNNFKSFIFSINEGEAMIAKGSFAIMLQ